jgi:fido (protein-threonine AMPylation protein)
VPLSEQKIPTVLSLDDSLSYVIGDEAKASGMEGVTNVFSFKGEIGNSPAEYSKGNRYFIAPGGNTKNSRVLSAKDATENYLKVLLDNFDETPDTWIVGQPSVSDETWLKNYRKHIRDAFQDCGYDSVEFWPEPFAVFQYYCDSIEEFRNPKGEELILVIDVGGGTFNSSIIHTTEKGDIGRGGAKRVPYGLHSEFVGGHVVDEAILNLVASRSKVAFKDTSILERVRKNAPQVLLEIEEAKIFLSKQFQASARSENHSVHLQFPVGTVHSEKTVAAEVSSDDLRRIVTKIWQKKWFPIVERTLKTAEFNYGEKIEKLDRVLIAGGSSQLPGMKLEVFKCLPTLLEESDIHIGANSESAVATGIALECKERSKTGSSLAVNHLANCLMNELYFGIRRSRKDDFERLTIKKAEGEPLANGQILYSPMESKDFRLRFEVNSPFDIGNKLIFGFANKPLDGDAPITLNPAPSDIVSIPSTGKNLKRNFELELNIDKSGQVEPKFIFHTKSRDNPHLEVKAPNFYIEDLRLEEGATYVGVDFGNTNSYVTKFMDVETEFSISEYPKFKYNKKTKHRLLELEKRLQKLHEDGHLSAESSLDSLQQHRLSIIYNSNKIEGNKLSLGETTSVFAGDDVVVDKHSRLEVLNLDNAYEFASENYDYLFEAPSMFIREVHKKITDGLLPSPGEYRSGPVEIYGVDFKPPEAALVASFMDGLYSDIRTRGEGRSPVEFIASIHTAFTMIHPFKDGNGRTARVIVAALLIEFGLPQIVIRIDDRARYMATLGDSNLGDISGVTNLIADLVQSELSTLAQSDVPLSEVQPRKKESPSIDLDFTELSNVVADGDKPRLDFSSFQQVLEDKENEANEARVESDYELWAASMNKFYVAFQDVCNQVSKNFEGKALQMNLKSYDSISYESYLSFQNEGQINVTWFFRVDVNWISHIPIMFAFVRAPAEIPDVDGGICLVISTPDQIQDGADPISGTMQKYVYVSDQVVKFHPGEANEADSLEQNILEFLTEVIRTFETD